MGRDQCPGFEYQPQHILLTDRKLNYSKPVEHWKTQTDILGVVKVDAVLVSAGCPKA